MPRLIHANPVYRLVEAYLKRLAKTANNRGERAILEKASRMIGAALLDPCCPGGDTTPLGRVENFFIIQLRSLLQNIDARKHRQILEKTRTLIANALEDPCCCEEDVFTTLPETVSGQGGETIVVSFCGIEADVPNVGDPMALAGDLANALNENATGVLSGTFSVGESTEIIYTGCACEDAELVMDSFGGG